MPTNILKQNNIFSINHKLNGKQQPSPLKSTNRASLIQSMSVQHYFPKRHNLQQDKLQTVELTNILASESTFEMRKSNSYLNNININIKSSKIVVQLSQQIQTYKLMYSRSCDIIKQLQCKLRSVLSQSQLSEQGLRSQISMLKADINFIQNQKERNIQNVKIKAQKKHFETIQKKQAKYQNEKILFEEQIARQKNQIYEMNLEIIRLRQKNTKNKENQSLNINLLQKRNKELKKQLQDLENKMKNQMKLRQEQLLKQFQADLNMLHQEQTNQIRVLCKRVNSLKITLHDKQNQIKQLWQARNLQANLLFSKNHISNSVIKQVDKTQATQADPSVKKYTQQIDQISLLDKYIR